MTTDTKALATLAALTMSSLEIAERTGKEHRNVLADIRRMVLDLGLNSAEFLAQYRDSTGRALPCYNLPKRETLILVSGYSVPLRAAIVDRWQELEAQQSPRIPTHIEALRLAADALEKAAHEESLKLIAQERVAVLEPVAAVGEQPAAFIQLDAAHKASEEARHIAVAQLVVAALKAALVRIPTTNSPRQQQWARMATSRKAASDERLATWRTQ